MRPRLAGSDISNEFASVDSVDEPMTTHGATHTNNSMKRNGLEIGPAPASAAVRCPHVCRAVVQYH